MAIYAIGHFFVHDRRMRLTVTCLALGNNGMLAAVTECTGKCLMLGHCFFQQFTYIFVARHAEGPRCGQGIIDLQRMMGRMTAEAVTGNLAFSMGLMAIRAIRNFAMHIMTESTGLLSMGTFIVGKILARAFMAGKTGLFYIHRQDAGQAVHGDWSGRKGSFPVQNGTRPHGTWNTAE